MAISDLQSFYDELDEPMEMGERTAMGLEGLPAAQKPFNTREALAAYLAEPEEPINKEERLDADRRMAILATGLGMLSAQGVSPLQALGAGGMQGLQTFRERRKEAGQKEEAAQKRRVGKLGLGLDVEKLDQQRAQAEKEIALNERRIAELEAAGADERKTAPFKRRLLIQQTRKEAADAALKERGGPLTAMQQKIAELMKTKVNGEYMDVETARGIATGRYVESRHPMTGEVIITDKATGKPLFAPEKAKTVSGEVMPPRREEELPDLGKATGAFGALKDSINTLTDTFGGGVTYKSTDQAKKALQNLQVTTETSLQAAIPGRPSNYLMQQLKKLTITPVSILQGSGSALSSAKETRNMLATEIRRIDEDILANPENFDKKEISNTRANRSQLFRLYKSYDQVVGNFEKKTEPSKTKQPKAGGQEFNWSPDGGLAPR